MPDYGSKYTEKRQRLLELRLKRVYTEAQKDLQGKLDSFVAKKERKQQEKLAQKKAGLITEQEYKDWLSGQVFMEKQWKAKVQQATDVLYHSNEKAVSMVRDEQMNVFTENANYQAYQVEKTTGFQDGISFELYDVATVDRLINEKPELLPRSNLKERKDRAWNQGIIANTITQGIIQGETIPQIAKRIARDTVSRNTKAMIRYARTAITGAENAGRMETMRRAEDMGINVKKQWLATLDRRTRDSHRHLDGQIRKIDEPFESELGEIMYPGDPEAEPGDVYNCRCTLTYIYPDYPSPASERIAYDEWEDEEGSHRESFIMGQDTNYGDWLLEKKRRHLEQANDDAQSKRQTIQRAMTESEYESWQKENSTRKELEKQFEKKYKTEIEKAEADKYKDFYIDSEDKWLSEIKNEWFDPLYQVSNGYGRCGYIQAADGSKAINAYLRRGEIGMYSVKEMKTTIDAMDNLIEKTTLDRQMLVDRCAGIDALERLGINCGEHGKTYRFGHAFCTDGVDLQAVVDRINNEYTGSTIIDKGFMSASVVPEKNVFGGSDVTFTVIAPKGTHAFISDNTRESEIVFKQGTEQTITGARVIKREAVDYEGNRKEREVIEVFVEITN